MSRTASHPRSALAAGALGVSASSILLDLSGTAAGTASFYRCLLSLPVLVLLAVPERRAAGPPPRRERRTALLAGAAFAGDMLLWTQAIPEVGAGLSTVLVNVQVVLVPLLAWLVDRETVSRRFLVTLPVLGVGIVLTGGVVGGASVGRDPALGTVHAVLAAVCYSLFLFLLRRGGGTGHVRQTYVLVIASATVVSLVLGAVRYGLDLAPGLPALGWLLAVALSSQVVGWLLVAQSSPHLPSHMGATLLLLTPAGAVVLGAAVLGEHPAPLQLAGCATLLAGAAFATRAATGPARKRKRKRQPQPQPQRHG
ncbi:DMT family transporter [Streptomyces sp. NPDC048172]|uniref:DMT family transporter n=1 Tax=Streptomyces sp. NPDC048172 TaxID=3365505 RepID=UPI0037151CE0